MPQLQHLGGGVFSADDEYSQRAAEIANSPHMSEDQKARALSALHAGSGGGRPAAPQEAEFEQIRQQYAEFLQQPLTPAGQAQEARQTLLPSREQQEFGAALVPHNKERARKAAADYIAVVKQASQPGVYDSDILDMRQQFEQKYPEFANLEPTAMSKEQIARMERELDIEKRRDLVESTGLPRNLLVDLDDNGKPVWAITPDQYMRSQYEEVRSQREFALKEREYYDNLLREHLKNRPEAPEATLGKPVGEREQRLFQLQQTQWAAQFDDLSRKAAGMSPRAAAEAMLPPEPPPLTPAQRAVESQSAYVNLTDKSELASGLESGRWPPGAVLQFGPYAARVNPDGRSVTLLDE